jgi:hypothetical protein
MMLLVMVKNPLEAAPFIRESLPPEATFFRRKVLLELLAGPFNWYHCDTLLL